MVFIILFLNLNYRTLPGEDASLNNVEPETIRQESSVLNRKLNQTGVMLWLCSSHYCIHFNTDLSFLQFNFDRISNVHSALFDTSIKSNPSKSVVGVGLKSWVKFGVAVTGKSNISVKFVLLISLLTFSGAQAEIEKLKFNQKRRQERGGRLEDIVFRQFLCDGQLRRERKSCQRRAKPAGDDISQYGQYYVNPVNWSLRSGNKTKLHDQQEENILKSQRELVLARQSIGYLTSTKAFLKFCKASNRFREAEFLKKFT